jgi:hypothetical protein
MNASIIRPARSDKPLTLGEAPTGEAQDGFSTDGGDAVRVDRALPGMKFSASPKVLVDVDRLVTTFLISVLLLTSRSTRTGATAVAITLSCCATLSLNSLSCLTIASYCSCANANLSRSPLISPLSFIPFHLQPMRPPIRSEGMTQGALAMTSCQNSAVSNRSIASPHWE